MSGQHAPVPPSGLARILQCPGSLSLEAKYPETEQSAPAAEGEAAHWVLEMAFKGETPLEDSTAPNGVVVTGEMLEGAELALDTIISDLSSYGMGPEDVAVEVPVSIPAVHPQCWGTPDMRTWVPASKTPSGRPRLLVWDYKFGHRVVEPRDNPQLAAYASGSISATKLADTDVDMVLSIIQPRAHHRIGPVRWWSAAASDLRAIINRASMAAHAAMSDNPATMTGPECSHCAARHACPTLQQVGYASVDLAGASQPLGLPPEALGLEVRTLREAADRLNARITGLEEQALAVLRAGARVPGLKLDRGAGRTVWAQPAADVIAMAQVMSGVSIAKPVAALTPKQAVKAGVPQAVVDALSESRSGELVLAIDDGSEARRVFG